MKTKRTKKAARGGRPGNQNARKGAGVTRVNFGARVAPLTADRIQEMARTRGVGVGVILDQLAEGVLS